MPGYQVPAIGEGRMSAGNPRILPFLDCSTADPGHVGRRQRGAAPGPRPARRRHPHSGYARRLRPAPGTTEHPIGLNLCQAQFGSVRREECWPRRHREGRSTGRRLQGHGPEDHRPRAARASAEHTPSFLRKDRKPLPAAIGVDNRTIVLYDGGEERLFYRRQEVGYEKR